MASQRQHHPIKTEEPEVVNVAIDERDSIVVSAVPVNDHVNPASERAPEGIASPPKQHRGDGKRTEHVMDVQVSSFVAT